jgi:bis(5'-nucleosidyl)-tetraphosphatase
MPLEKSAGAVIFRKEGNGIYYLLLHYSRGARKPEPYWDFPKGHIEKGEKELDTVKREVREETGLKDIEILEDFKEWIKYFFQWGGENILKFVSFYLAETKTKDVIISGEHIGFQWLSYEKALSQLTFKNAKTILQKANNFLSRKSI